MLKVFFTKELLLIISRALKKFTAPRVLIHSIIILSFGLKVYFGRLSSLYFFIMSVIMGRAFSSVCVLLLSPIEESIIEESLTWQLVMGWIYFVHDPLMTFCHLMGCICHLIFFFSIFIFKDRIIFSRSKIHIFSGFFIFWIQNNSF